MMQMCRLGGDALTVRIGGKNSRLAVKIGGNCFSSDLIRASDVGGVELSYISFKYKVGNLTPTFFCLHLPRCT